MGNSEDSFIPPNNTVSLKLQGCHKIVVLSRVLNFLPNIKNLTLTGSEKLVLRSRIYESRLGTGHTAHVKNIEISDVRKHSSKNQ